MVVGQGPVDHRMFLIGAIPALAFLAWCMWLLQRALASRGWPTTEGRILDSQVQPTGRGGAVVLAYYEYSVDGQEYTGKRVRFAPGYPMQFDAAQADALNYRPGSSIQIHYDPAAPNDAVIVSGVAPALWFCIAGSAAFVAFTLAEFLLH